MIPVPGRCDTTDSRSPASAPLSLISRRSSFCRRRAGVHPDQTGARVAARIRDRLANDPQHLGAAMSERAGGKLLVPASWTRQSIAACGLDLDQLGSADLRTRGPRESRAAGRRSRCAAAAHVLQGGDQLRPPLLVVVLRGARAGARCHAHCVGQLAQGVVVQLACDSGRATPRVPLQAARPLRRALSRSRPRSRPPAQS